MSSTRAGINKADINSLKHRDAILVLTAPRKLLLIAFWLRLQVAQTSITWTTHCSNNYVQKNKKNNRNYYQ